MDYDEKKPGQPRLEAEPYDKVKEINQHQEKDIVPSVGENEEQGQELPHVDVEYDLTADDVRSGLHAFQKKMLYKRNIIYTVLFGIFFILYGGDMILNNNRTIVAYLGLILCVVVIVFIWMNLRRHREQMAKAMSEVDEKFTMQVYQEFIYIQQENGGFRIHFNNPKVFILDDELKFIIGIGKEQIYLLPKRCLDAQQLSKITEIFETLGERLQRIPAAN